MNICYQESRLQDLKTAKKHLLGSHDKIDLNHAHDVVRSHLIDNFPLNQIPNDLVQFLDIYKERIKKAENILILIIDRLIEEYEKKTEGSC